MEGQGLLVISHHHRERLLELAQQGLPDEIGGLLFGRVRPGLWSVRTLVPMENIEASPTSFAIDPLEQSAALHGARGAGSQFLGSYHSHPLGPAWPSLKDVERAFDPSLIHLIISLQNKEIRAFFIKADQIEEITIQWEDRVGT